jgi:hypothetical protein
MKNSFLITSIVIFFFSGKQTLNAQDFGRYRELDYLAHRVKSVTWVSGESNKRDFYFEYEYKSGKIIQKYNFFQDSIEKHYFYTDSTRFDSIIAYVKNGNSAWKIDNKSFFCYNSQGQLRSARYQSYNNWIVLDSFSYNSKGLVEKGEQYKCQHYQSENGILSADQLDTFSLQNVKQYQHNKHSMLISETQNDMTYMSYVYDARQRLAQVTEFLGLSAVSEGNNKNFVYKQYRFTRKGLLEASTITHYSVAADGQIIHTEILKQRCQYTFYKK